MGMVGLETALPVVQQAMVDTGLLDWAGVADRMSHAPARIGRLSGTGAPDRGRRTGQPDALRPGRAWVVEPADLVSRPATPPTPVATLPGRVVATFLRGGRPFSTGRPSEASARRAAAGLLVLEDGRAFRGDAYGADGRDVRRGGLRHRHDGLPGDADRPVVPPAGRDPDRPAHRQHRRQRRGPRVAADLGRGVRRAGSRPRAVQLAVARQSRRRAGGRRCGRDRGCRHPRAHATSARTRRDAGRDLHDRARSATRCWRGCSPRPDGGRRAGRRGDDTGAVRRPRARSEEVHGGGGRPRDQGDDAPSDGRARDGGARAALDVARSTTCSRSNPTACSCPTGRATRNRWTHTVGVLRGVLAAGTPFFGICLGNQVFGRALGFGTYKLPYGHRGINQPVQDRRPARSR